MANHLKQQGGFTIIEFLIAVTILGILTSWAVPAFVGFIDTYRVESIQRNFASSYKFSQSEAIKRNHTIVMCKAALSGTSCDTTANATWQQGWYIFDDLNGNGAIDSVEILRQQAPVDDIRFLGANSFVFNGAGNLGLGAGNYTVCAEKQGEVWNDPCTAPLSTLTALNSGQFVIHN